MHFIVELLLQPIVELAFSGLGYATAWVVVPLSTFGRVVVEPGGDGKFSRPQHSRIRRIRPGKYVLEAELAAGIGILFWIAVAAVAYTLLSGCSGQTST